MSQCRSITVKHKTMDSEVSYNEKSGLYLTREIGDRFVGIDPVIFGVRVKSGYIGQMYYAVEYCCGVDMIWSELVYNWVAAMVAAGIPYSEFPAARSRPTHNDMEFVEKVLKGVACYCGIREYEHTSISREILEACRKDCWDRASGSEKGKVEV